MGYEEFGLNDISLQLEEWIEYAEDTHEYIHKIREDLIESDYWNKVGFNFQLTIKRTLTYFNTIQEDLTRVRKAIIEDSVFVKEVNLLKKIGINSRKYQKEYIKSFDDEYLWHDYTDYKFKLAVNILHKGRDFFVDLRPAEDLAERLNDYVNINLPSNSVINFNNKINSETVYLQQGTSNTIIKNNPEHAKIEELISNLEKNMLESEKTISNEYLEVLKKELKKEKPKKNLLTGALEGLKKIESTVEFTLILNTLSKLVISLFNL